MAEKKADNDTERIFSYGSAITVVRLNEKDISSYLNQGLISTDYQGRKARNTSYDCVCFTILPIGKNATERVAKIVQENWNWYLRSMIAPQEWFKEEEGIVLSAVIADFELISKCRNVRLVNANGYLPAESFPEYVSGINHGSFVSCKKGHPNMFTAEVRVYLENAQVTPPDPSLTGITQEAWKGLMFKKQCLPRIAEWFKKLNTQKTHIRNLPVYDENQLYLGSTHELFGKKFTD